MCRYGVMPANGLVYAPPHQCGCFIEAKLNGFLALAPARKSPLQRSPGNRTEKGPAYTQLPDPQAPIPSPADWPVFRHDNARSGFSPSSVAAELSQKWATAIGGTLTASTVADGKLFVASRDTHRVCCLDEDSGKQLWQYTTGGSVDTPPTYHRGRVFFGCKDGRVYCLTAAEGKLVWRFAAAPNDSRIVAFGQLESDPDNPDLNLDAGLAFAAARILDRACDCFSKGSDETLKLLATEVRRLALEPNGTLAAGDLWWDAAAAADSDFALADQAAMRQAACLHKQKQYARCLIFHYFFNK